MIKKIYVKYKQIGVFDKQLSIYGTWARHRSSTMPTTFSIMTLFTLSIFFYIFKIIYSLQHVYR